MAELRLTLDLRLPPDPAVIAPLWAAAGIKHSPPEVCRMLLLAQLAAPLDENGWQGAAVIVGAALEAVAPEHDAEAAEAEAEPAESVVYAEMAAAFDRPAPPGGAIRNEATSTTIDPGPILIEDDDDPAPAMGGGVAPAPEPMAEVAPEPVVEPAAPDWPALIDRVEAGESIGSVAKAAGVNGRALGCKVTARRRLLKPAGPEAAAIPSVEAAPAAVLAEPPAQVAPEEKAADDGSSIPSAAEDAFWTPQRDLALVQAMIGGRGSYAASQQLGCKPPDCVNRFKQLLPQPGTVAQQQLLKRLRAQVEAEGGHGA